MTSIFKILDHSEWKNALSAGFFHGSDVDRADGFIHFSTTETVRETARKHFSKGDNLLLIAVSADALGPTLRWEPSRGGLLFPHLYGPLDVSLALSVEPLPREANGELRFPDRIP